MFREYPYTNLQDLNLDWILRKMKEVQKNLDDLLETAIAEATANAIEYLNTQLGRIEAEFAEVERQFALLENDVDALNDAFNRFTVNINNQFNALKGYVDDALTAQQLQMQLMISQNNEYLLSQMETYLAQIKVINYFTGEKTSIQDMFNYLAGLHLTDAINYTTMAARGKTYTQLAGLNITYTDLAIHGNTLYV